ncbi:beta strand repeat-containing protein [Deinococcus radiopugnans]|nr:SdrD B-like domain-containing protein [Deinococcus radiopugnans]MBB6017184.1 putative repeat protein (TIGR01451 family) [Deinococcus radiopugnans ATCC 19172]
MAASVFGTAFAEGSVQTSLGSTASGEPFNQYLYAYDVTSQYIKTNNRPVYADILSSGEVINISLCGAVDADPLRIEIYNPSGTLVQTFVPIAGKGKIACNSTLSGPITTAYKYTTTTTGAYQIRLYNTNGGTADERYFKRFDITVTPNNSINPDPRLNSGRIWGRAWAFNGYETYTATGSTDSNYFVRVPGGRTGSEYIWKLDLNKFAGFRYDIIANSIGLDAPNSGYSAEGTASAAPLHPIYLSYPAQASSPPTLPPVISNFRFEGDGGRTFISPGNTVGMNDTGRFKFTGDVDGTYTITIDTNKDGVYGTGDRLLLGTSLASTETSVVWDGKNAAGTVLPIGNYNAELKVRLGEYHFVAYDVETSGGGDNNGLTVYRATSQTGTSNTQVYWDDVTKLPGKGGTSNLPSGGASGTAAGTHTWGNFAAGGLGDTRYLDTYVYGLVSSVLSSAVITNGDATITGKVYNDTNRNGVADGGETGIPSATLQLLNSSQAVVATVQADTSGNYTFLGIAAGTYTVRVISDSAVNGKTPTIPAPAQLTVAVTDTAANGNNFGFVPSADLAITKTDGVGSVNSGNNTTYTIRVTNNGPSSVTGAVVKDPTATGLNQTAAACTAVSGNTCTTAPTTAALQSAGGVTLPALATGAFYEFTVTANVTAASGSVSNTVTVAVPVGATDPTAGNNSATDTDIVTSLFFISGNVYEDYNYGGGAGRIYNAAEGMSLRPSVRVELYNNAGAFIDAKLTDASGGYTFANQLPGDYKVRVVNSFVTSSRAGACAPAANVSTPPAGCMQLPVQTYVSGNTAQVGGAFPKSTDPALSTGTLPVGAQSVASVTVGSSNVANVDFGYNFSTVVNTGDAATPGQGSLRQFIVNANALANNTLAQSGNRGAVVTGASQTLPSARDTSIFMIPSGALTGGVAIITSTGSVMPAITRSNVSVDGTTQSVNVGNTNTGVLGTGGTVGYLNTATLDMVQKPEVQLVGTSALLVGLDLQANDLQVRGMSVYGFGNQANQNNHANIRIGNNFTGSLIEANILGSPASSFGCGASTTAALSNADNIRSVGGDGGTVRNNLIGCAAGKGFGVEGGSENWTITNNEIRGNGIGNTNLDGIDLENSGSKNHTVSGNLITENSGVGVDGYQGSGGNTIERNTITGNGIGQGGAPGETSGIRIYSSNNAVRNNVIAQNYGAGILVVSGHTGNLISQNSMYDNGTIAAANGAAASNQIGIDLLAAGDSASAGTAPYVTRNDSGDGDTGGNDLLNFPVFEMAQIVSGKLQLSGFARPGSAIELFIAAADASGFGEGRTYLVTLIEGSAADTDGGTGTYTDTLTGTDTTNRFRFSVPLPNGVTVGTRLTATATCSAASCPGTTVSVSSETSEFSYNVVVTAQPPSISLLKLGRNTAGGPFTDSSTLIGVRPGESVEYCVIYSNAGGEATNFVLRDYVPSGLVPQLSAYGTRGGGQALGLKYAPGVALTAGAADSAAVMPPLTSVSDGDEGALSNVPVTNPGDPVGSPQRPGLMTLTLPSVPAGGQGTVCFQAKVP